MAPTDRLRQVRYLAAGMAALVAVIYLLIGFNVVTVVDAQEPGLVPPMLIAGGLFAVLAAALALSARRAVWVLGAALQVLVLIGYLVISAERTPAFEAWGLVQKGLQVALLGAFVYLAVRRTPRRGVRPGAAGTPRPAGP